MRSNKNIFIQSLNKIKLNKLKFIHQLNEESHHVSNPVLPLMHDHLKFKNEKTLHKNKGKLESLKKCIFIN